MAIVNLQVEQLTQRASSNLALAAMNNRSREEKAVELLGLMVTVIICIALATLRH